MAKVMDNRQFVETCCKLAQSELTVYAKGMYGKKLTKAIINDKARQYPQWYNADKVVSLNTKIGYYGFDCVCMIKGILWGWENVKYGTNGVSDMAANSIIAKTYSEGISTDFTKIEKGEIVWKDGHVGVYIGDGIVVECTNTYKDGVQFSALANVKAPNKTYTTRCHGKYTTKQVRWEKHAKLKYIDYKYLEAEKPVVESKPVVEPVVESNPVVEISKYFPQYKGRSTSIVDGLKSVGVSTTFSYRRKIAAKNKIVKSSLLYLGTAKQNTEMMNLLKKGKLLIP